eukprot:UN17307
MTKFLKLTVNKSSDKVDSQSIDCLTKLVVVTTRSQYRSIIGGGHNEIIIIKNSYWSSINRPLSPGVTIHMNFTIFS